MGGCGLSLFNAFFYLAAHFTSAINLGIIQSIMPAMILLGSYLIFGTVVNRLQVTGLVLTFLGCIIVAAQGSIGNLLLLTFNIGDIWMLVCVLSWSLYSTLLKKNKLQLSQFSLIQIMVTVGLIFLVPQFLYEQSVGLNVKINKAFIFILTYVVIFPAIAAYYCWQKAIELIGPNRSSMFIQLMPLFSALMAIIIFKEKFQLFHFIGATFIISGIYLSNRKIQ